MNLYEHAFLSLPCITFSTNALENRFRSLNIGAPRLFISSWVHTYIYSIKSQEANYDPYLSTNDHHTRTHITHSHIQLLSPLI